MYISVSERTRKKRNLEAALENKEVVRNIPGHQVGEFKGYGAHTHPCKFELVGIPHEELLKAIVEASTRKSAKLFFVYRCRVVKIEMTVIQWVSERWIERLQRYLCEHKNESFIPDEDDFEPKNVLINTPWVLELTISNAK
jgi:hypothetical protein